MLDQIIESFTSLSAIGWASQICGFIGLIVLVISYQFDRTKFLALATLSFVFFILEQSLALAFTDIWSSLIVCLVSFVRNLLMFIIYLKYKKNLPKWSLYVMVIVTWIAEIVHMAVTKSFNDWTNYLPPAMMTMLTFMQNSNNYYVLKSGVFLHEFGFLVYFIIFSLPVSVIRQIILVTSALVSIVIMLIKDIKKKKEVNPNV